MGTQIAANPVMPRLLERYRKEIVPALVKRFGYTNPMQVPRLAKIVINMGVGIGAEDLKAVEQAAHELALITGQRPVITRARRAISNFKIKEGSPIGCKVTLHRAQMHEFLDRFISVALPRIRDFRGVPRASLDGTGNYTLGIAEQLIFPEIEYDQVKRTQGMHITLVTTAKTNEEAYELLKALGLPFREGGKDELQALAIKVERPQARIGPVGGTGRRGGGEKK